MKKQYTKLIIATSIVASLSGCATTAQDVAITAFADAGVAAVRTNWSADDFGVMDGKLQGKNTIYVSYDLKDMDGDSKQGRFQDMQSYTTCKNIKESINSKYKCFVTKRDYKQLGKAEFYKDIKPGGLELRVTKPVKNGIIGGTNYTVDVFDTNTGNKIDSFKSNALYQNSTITSNEIAEYVGEYIYYLDKKTQ
jgi:hypothetical protein